MGQDDCKVAVVGACHSERSEESLVRERTLRCAQSDRVNFAIVWLMGCCPLTFPPPSQPSPRGEGVVGIGMTPTPHLSVVIPAYNEEIRISRTIREIVSYLSEQDYEWEIVVADDGSSDATARLVPEAADGDPRVRVLSLEHRGKGWAVKNGMLAASGDFRLLSDADLSVPIAQVERLLPPQAAAWTWPLAHGRLRARPATANRAAAT